MKGKVYGGVAYFPKHAAADLHGLLRCIVRTAGITELTSILRIYDIAFSPVLFNWSIWAESKSMAEQAATELHYGRVLVCRLNQQYLPGCYELIPETLKRTYRPPAPVPSTIPAAAIGRHLYSPEEGTKRCKVCHNFGYDDPIHIKLQV